MILSDIDIKEAIKEKKIIIEPEPEENQFSSSALDLRLNGEFKEYDKKLVCVPGVEVNVDLSELDCFAKLKGFLRDLDRQADGSFILKPKDFILGQTLERITLPIDSQIAARVEGRSTTARLGLVVHLSAPTIHAGFSGKITLEIINHGPCTVRLDPQRDRICQLIFEKIASRPSKANLSHFQNQSSVVGNQIPS